MYGPGRSEERVTYDRWGAGDVQHHDGLRSDP
jgi:hypothetical protein